MLECASKGAEGKSELEQFKSNQPQFQTTFETPLKNLRSFVETIIEATDSPAAATAVIDQVIFEPRALARLMMRHSIDPAFERGFRLRATGVSHVKVLLRAMLNEWIDFLFLPNWQSFAIYADHDEFTTFYFSSRPVVDHISEVLLANGFKPETKFVRRF